MTRFAAELLIDRRDGSAPMTMSLGTIERAFELAQSGHCATVDDIRRNLKGEGFAQVDAHLAGATVRKQLLELCRQARAES
jgi:hypothetical protein